MCFSAVDKHERQVARRKERMSMKICGSPPSHTLVCTEAPPFGHFFHSTVAERRFRLTSTGKLLFCAESTQKWSEAEPYSQVWD
jgi:hypothetical protein